MYWARAALRLPCKRHQWFLLCRLDNMKLIDQKLSINHEETPLSVKKRNKYVISHGKATVLEGKVSRVTILSDHHGGCQL